jgi:ribonuclease Z
MKKLIIGLLTLTVLGVGFTALFGEKILRNGMTRFASERMAGKTLSDLPDGLHVFLCGAGSPMPDPLRSGPCTIVVAGERVLVVDSGSGAVKNFGLMGIPVGEVDDLLLTHFHSDHIDGVGELATIRWAGGHHNTPLPVHGPSGVEKVIAGFNAAYSQDKTYRVAHHGAATVQPSGAGLVALPFLPPADGETTIVIEQGGLKVTSVSVGHAPIYPAVAYRFDYKGRSVVISGDTVRSDDLTRLTAGADVLVHEALNADLLGVLESTAKELKLVHVEKIMNDILNYHSSPVDAAKVAKESGAKQLLLNHIVPPLPIRPMERLFVEGVSEVYDGPVTVGRDGSYISLPANSDAVESGNLL